MARPAKPPLQAAQTYDWTSDRSSGSFHHSRPSRNRSQWTAWSMAFLKLTAAGPLPICTGFPFTP